MTRWRLPARTRLLLPVLFLLPLLAARPALAQPEAEEYEIKAAFLYNFAAYVEWPDDRLQSDQDPIVFGVVGAPELADNLEMLGAVRNINGRAIEVRRIRRRDDADGLHILFIDASLQERADELLSDALGQGVLTVTESQDERHPDSIINFQIVDAKVRFDVSLSRAQEVGLSISSQLLQVAQRVL